ncbi:MAG: sialate O-acetylesterase [Bacteroidetes bacterium]|nr:sialate O-acetylesterase [Bacteroidota bacterium]
MKRVNLIFFLIIFLQSGLFGQTWDSSYQTTYYEQKVTLFRALPDRAGEIVFLGNSITDMGEWSEIWQNNLVINRGISGDITYGVLARMDEVLSAKPSKIFILIGVNDVSRNTPDEVIVRNYNRIVERVEKESPQTTVLVQSILPTNDAFARFKAHQGKTDHILSINAQLKEMCQKRGHVYVDLYPHFLNADKKLDVKYTNDGLHLNGAGYLKWKQVLIDLKLM